MAGLLELGELEEARDYLAEIVAARLGSAEDLRARIAPPAVAALLLAKQTVAAEHEVDARGHRRRLAPRRTRTLDAQRLMTILGNLIDNAIEALAAPTAARGRSPSSSSDDDDVRIVVSDNGPGIAAADLDDVFLDG